MARKSSSEYCLPRGQRASIILWLSKNSSDVWIRRTLAPFKAFQHGSKRESSSLRGCSAKEKPHENCANRIK